MFFRETYQKKIPQRAPLEQVKNSKSSWNLLHGSKGLLNYLIWGWSKETRYSALSPQRYPYNKSCQGFLRLDADKCTVVALYLTQSSALNMIVMFSHLSMQMMLQFLILKNKNRILFTWC